MKSFQLAPNEYLLVFTEPDDELIAGLTDFAAANDIQSGRLQAIGSVSAATLAWWSDLTKQVEKYSVDGQYELVSFLGNIAAANPDDPKAPRIHAHAVMTGPGGIVAGHAVSLTVRASVEVNVTVFDTPVTRTKNDAFGLYLLG
jgi:predicted DNA-binding protein with PD1-like motif